MAQAQRKIEKTEEEPEVIKLLKPIQIPPQPQLLIDLEQAGNDIQKIAKLVVEDPSVAAAVLKTVNSPFFGLSKEITDIKQATMLLGLDYIKSIINAILIQGAFKDIPVEQLAAFWQSTNDVAAAASIVAKHSNACEANEAYLLGLFHNAGMPLLLQKHPNYLVELKAAYNVNDQNLTEHENKLYNANHAVVGYYISRTWNLPKRISIAIRDHHDRSILSELSSCQDSEMAYLLATLKVGEFLVKEYTVLSDGKESCPEWGAIGPIVMDLLGLQDDDMATLRELVSDAIGA